MLKNSAATESVLLIDGYSLAFRAFFSYPATLTWSGKPINAVYGFVSMLFSAIEKVNPDYVCVCFDRPEPTFRHLRYVEYKAHRPPTPELFLVQIPILFDLLKKLDIPVVDQVGFEADDLLGTFSRLAAQEKKHAFILTGDQDSFQLVNDFISILINKKGVSELWTVTPEEIEAKYGMGPHSMIDFKALKGDPSDNIPGVAGIGEKTAMTLLHRYKTLEAIYEHLNEITPAGVQTKLTAGKDMAFLSKELVTIETAVPVTQTISDFKINLRWNVIVPLFREYQFKSLAQRYQSKEGTGSALSVTPPSQKDLGTLFSTSEPEGESLPSGSLTSPHTHVQLIETEDALKSILPLLQNGFAIDLETTSLRPHDAQIVGVALSIKTGEAFYIPFNAYLTEEKEAQHSLFDFSAGPKNQAIANPLLALLKPLLENPSIPKTTHHGKYETNVFRRAGVGFEGISFDTLLAAYLVFPGERLGLKALAEMQLGVKMTEFEEVTGKGKQQVRFDKVPVDQAMMYAGADADCTLRLKGDLAPQVTEKGMGPLFYEIELPLQNVLADMEYRGVHVDIPYLTALSTEFEHESAQIQKTIFEMAGTSFNLNSPKQLGDILFDKMGLPALKKTKTGRSTDSSVLEKLVPLHDIAGLILKYRTLEKLQNTYLKVIPLLVNPATRKIHTSFNQTVAITGRLSSADPNLQNIPIRTEEGAKIRRAFIPSPGNLILSADYSQIELRILAHLAHDENMVGAFNRGEDIHAATAAVIENIPVSEVTKEQRYRAKAVNFGIIYGISAFGLSENITIGRKEAQAMIDHYFEIFPKIQGFMDETVEFARSHAFVKTEFGRVRPIPDIVSKNHSIRQFAERTAVNTRVQGTAADIIKIAMIRIQKRLKAEHFKSQLIIQVHDELVFDMDRSEQSQLIALVKAEMEGVVQFSVPLSVDVEIGKNWLDLEKVNPIEVGAL